jgi:hypothetical protein
MTSPVRIGLLLALTLLLTCGNTCNAQFDIDNLRWTGNTAQTQAQGFDQGDPLRLTWGILSEGTSINGFIGEPTSANDIRSFFNGIHGSEAAWQPIFESTFDRWSSISGLDYSFEAADDGANFVSAGGFTGVRADVRIGAHSINGPGIDNVLAYNFFPNTGDMVIDSDNLAFYSNGANNFRGTRNVLMHETGHGIGMEHLFSNNSEQLMEPFINNNFDGPQHFDILAAQRGYGDFNEKSFGQLGNDVAARATDLGSLAVGDSFAIGQDAQTLVVTGDADDFFSIDDTTDIDFYQFTVADSGLIDIDLEALGFTIEVDGQGSDGMRAGNSIDFNTQERSDLTLQLFDSNSVLLGSSNFTGLGGMESLTGIALGPGTYFVEISGVNNADANLLDTQFYGLTASFSAVPEPSSAVLMMLGVAGVTLRRRRRRA